MSSKGNGENKKVPRPYLQLFVLIQPNSHWWSIPTVTFIGTESYINLPGMIC